MHLSTYNEMNSKTDGNNKSLCNDVLLDVIAEGLLCWFVMSCSLCAGAYIGWARTRERVSGVIWRSEAMNTSGARKATCGMSLQKRT